MLGRLTIDTFSNVQTLQEGESSAEGCMHAQQCMPDQHALPPGLPLAWTEAVVAARGPTVEPTAAHSLAVALGSRSHHTAVDFAVLNEPAAAATAAAEPHSSVNTTSTTSPAIAANPSAAAAAAAADLPPSTITGTATNATATTTATITAATAKRSNTSSSTATGLLQFFAHHAVQQERQMAATVHILLEPQQTLPHPPNADEFNQRRRDSMKSQMIEAAEDEQEFAATPKGQQLPPPPAAAPPQLSRAPSTGIVTTYGAGGTKVHERARSPKRKQDAASAGNTVPFQRPTPMLTSLEEAGAALSSLMDRDDTPAVVTPMTVVAPAAVARMVQQPVVSTPATITPSVGAGFRVFIEIGQEMKTIESIVPKAKHKEFLEHLAGGPVSFMSIGAVEPIDLFATLKENVEEATKHVQDEEEKLKAKQAAQREQIKKTSSEFLALDLPIPIISIPDTSKELDRAKAYLSQPEKKLQQALANWPKQVEQQTQMNQAQIKKWFRDARAEHWIKYDEQVDIHYAEGPPNKRAKGTR
jgi:hypothetical protein